MQQPPKWITYFLSRVCPDALQDEIIGDMHEYYAYLVKTKGYKTAKRRMVGFMLASTPRLLLNRRYHKPTSIDMLRNYIVIALRNIRRQWGYSLINIFGLAVGLACCLLIGIYVNHELSYDQFHAKADQLYRVNVTYSTAGQSSKMYMTPTALLPNMKREFNEVKNGARVFNVGIFSPKVLQKGNVKYQEERFFYVDSAFLDLFSFQLIKGNPNKALSAPNSIVITEATAQKYFGDDEPMGEFIKVDGKDYTITGVLQNIPNNSHLQFDVLASFSSLRVASKEIWGSANYATYVELAEGANPEVLAQNVQQMVTKKLGDSMGDLQIQFELMPLTDIHLYSDVPNEIQPQNDIRYIYVISVVGLLILIIASINYMNLATARSAERAREVGMRKVLGAVRNQLFYQFIGESLILTIIASILALLIVSMFLAPFNDLTGKLLEFKDVFNSTILLGVGAIVLLVSFFAGAYPALSLASFVPAKVLKGRFTRSRSGNLMRQMLVVFQFSISIFLIIGTLVIYKQLSYMRDKKLGYNKENVMILPTDREVNKNFSTLKNVLERRNDVLGLASASESPTEINGGYSLKLPGLLNDPVSINAVSVDPGFVQTMGIGLSAGRDFNENDLKLSTLEDYEKREYNFLVNEQFLKHVMLSPDEAVGREASLNGRNGKIVGIIDDFHFASLHSKISPLVLFLEPTQFNKLFIRIKPQSMQKTLMAIENEWKQIVPGRPFVFQFMDDEYEALYKNEARLSKVFTLFAVLAIIIACLGLFGLVSFAVEQRQKEIGVRKALGASVSSLFLLISMDFSKLVLISFVIAAPLGYWVMNNWLTDFEYRVSVGFLPIILAVVCTLLVAFLTVSYQSMKAAFINPAETLRAE